MEATATVPTKSRRTNKLVTKTMLKQVIRDLTSGKITLRGEGHGLHLLTAVGDTKTSWEFDVFGLFFDRAADFWQQDRVSSAHPETYYYVPMVGRGKTATQIGLDDIMPRKVQQALIDLTYSGSNCAAKLAEYLGTPEVQDRILAL